MKVYEWDAGFLLTTYQEFGGRVIQKDRPSEFSDHSTHMAGTMVASGVNAKAKGMVPKADWDNDKEEVTEAVAQGQFCLITLMVTPVVLNEEIGRNIKAGIG
ncbi:hypothetical protein [Riemerella columbipharyngis]|uniref:Peptidase S8/S53 domain-containing protein n=1 Tax=Riemerella columbipharyngis TaxID=1071918 RepID=A0A1G7API6_9FLAO|nr:hypothetical protein [Riemerella columbipharyngis]SDE16834.1 hypothetical protein SAMN05421544_10451 [Riemerella columbipharyngis]